MGKKSFSHTEQDEDNFTVFDYHSIKKNAEYNRKHNRPQSEEHFHGKNGHTMRRNDCFHDKNGNNVVIARGKSCHNPVGHSSECMTTEAPVTEVDKYFDSAFWVPNRCFENRCYGYDRAQAARPLNTTENWELIEDLLYETAISVSKDYNPARGQAIHRYEIPVNGHYIFSKASPALEEDVENDELAWWLQNKCNYLSKLSRSQRYASFLNRGNAKKQFYHSKWLFWNGKYYNPNYIYEYVPCEEYKVKKSSTSSTDTTNTTSPFVIEGMNKKAPSLYQEHSGYLRPLCPYIIHKDQDPLMQLGDTEIDASSFSNHPESALVRSMNRNSLQNHLAISSMTSSSTKLASKKHEKKTLNKLMATSYYEKSILSAYHSKYYTYATGTTATKKAVTSNKAADMIEIDLHTLCDIKAIGLLGGYPQHMRLFPDPHHHDADFYMIGNEKRRKRKLPKRCRQVHVIQHTQRDIAWVTSYTIHYRDMTNGKWYPYQQGGTMTGNYDVEHEVLQEVSIMTRYLRITPIDYHHAIAMRIMVYGDSIEEYTPKTGKKNSQLTLFASLVEGEGNKELGEKKKPVNTAKIPTIQYSIYYPSKPDALRMESSVNYKYKTKYDWWRGESKWEARQKNIQSIIQDGYNRLDVTMEEDLSSSLSFWDESNKVELANDDQEEYRKAKRVIDWNELIN